jgi:hypothetical protein
VIILYHHFMNALSPRVILLAASVACSLFAQQERPLTVLL